MGFVALVGAEGPCHSRLYKMLLSLGILHVASEHVPRKAAARAECS